MEIKPLKPINNNDLFRPKALPDDIVRLISGRSYPEEARDHIALDDLRYILLLHYDFAGGISYGELITNAEIANEASAVFKDLYQAKYPIESIRLIDYYDADDESSMRANNSSCFCFRKIHGETKLSKHAFGMAIDVNPLYNPYIKIVGDDTILQPANSALYVDRDGTFPHKLTNDDFAVQCFKHHGFSWGGDWSNPKDYQHFEI